MSDFLTLLNNPNIIEAAKTLIMAIVVYALWPYVKTKVSEEKLKQIAKLVTTFVFAAEQSYKGEKGKGAEKKTEVVNNLIVSGVEITPQVDALIESAVYDMNNTKVGE